MSYYETERALSEYLLLHYGEPEQVLPYDFGPSAALHFPIRCVSECLIADRLPADGRALDLGCAVGRSSFELARHCAQVTGIDYARRLIEAAQHVQRDGSLNFCRFDEGDLTTPCTACVPLEIDRRRVSFEQGDAHNLRANLGVFDVVLMANLLDRLHAPRQCLAQLADLLKPGGQLILTSPYTWLPEFTPRENWLGGYEQAGKPIRTLDTLLELLMPSFDLVTRKDLPFLIREHARKFQWGVAEAITWVRK